MRKSNVNRVKQTLGKILNDLNTILSFCNPTDDGYVQNCLLRAREEIEHATKAL